MKIDTVNARSRLRPRREPYWHRISKGNYLGFRRNNTGGTWLARTVIDRHQQYHALGEFAEVPDHLRFDLAQKAANEWFAHLAAGGLAKTLTLGQACERYVKKLESEGRTRAAADAAARFRRWVFSDSRLSATPVQKITPAQLAAWRTALARKPVIAQDKTQESTQRRSDATLNRDMTSLRAALNLALLDGYVLTDAAWRAKLRPIKSAGTRREIYLDDTQRRQLIEHAPSELVSFLRGLCALPLRPGAVAALTVADFDKRLSSLKVSADKHGKGRSIPLPSSLASFINEHADGKLPGAPLLSRANGKAWTKDAWKYPFKEAVKAAGLPPETVAYSVRHSVITDLIALHRLDTMTVALLSGTSVQMIDKHYGHLLKDHAARALDKIAI